MRKIQYLLYFMVYVVLNVVTVPTPVHLSSQRHSQRWSTLSRLQSGCNIVSGWSLEVIWEIKVWGLANIELHAAPPSTTCVHTHTQSHVPPTLLKPNGLLRCDSSGIGFLSSNVFPGHLAVAIPIHFNSGSAVVQFCTSQIKLTEV